MWDHLPTVLTSAAVAALISSGVVLLNGVLERGARRDEVLLQRAFDLARNRMDLLFEDAKRSGGGYLPDAVWLIDDYVRMLRHMLDKGALPPDVQARKDAAQRPATP